MDIRTMSALEQGRAIREKQFSSEEATRCYLDAIQKEDESVGAYISVLKDTALQQAREVQKKIDSGRLTGLLAGVPAAIKDNICMNGSPTTSASRMLKNFRPPYDATIVTKMQASGAVVLGKTNLDEFAMGGSTETSYCGITKNPWNTERVPGGSSGGSAAAVAAELAPYAIGSDTGGSIRQPCCFCGLTGIKPTYGSVSRYGLMAYASSLDQIGAMGKNAEDCAAVLEMISGKDDKDSTSVMNDPFDFSGAFENQEAIRGMKVALPKNYFELGISPEVKDIVLNAARKMSDLGADVEEISIPLIEYAVPAYYIIACAEASSNLSRYDGIKYGYRSEEARDILEIYYKSRSEGFGTEVRRRIMLGSFVLSSGYFDAYYKKALQVRGLIKKSFDEAFEKFDLILSPVSPTVAYKIGDQISDPLAMYLADIYTVSVNLAGLPGLALPCGFDGEGLPVGMQLIGRAFSEKTLMKAAFSWQQATDYHKQRPALCRNRKEG